MRARDQSSIFSIGGKFHPDYGLILELHALTLVTRSYALLITVDSHPSRCACVHITLGKWATVPATL